jgi:hypothetical protein
MVKTYDPKNISIILGGKIITGFADGTWIEVDRNEDAWTLKVGVDGEGARAKNNNKSGKVTITLMQTSSSNDVLSAYALADELGNAGAVPFFMKDSNGSSLFTALTMWVKKMAKADNAKEVKERVWVLETDELIMNVGGNNA